MKLEIKPFVLGANALLKELEDRPCNRVLVCESRLSELIETSEIIKKQPLAARAREVWAAVGGCYTKVCVWGQWHHFALCKVGGA